MMGNKTILIFILILIVVSGSLFLVAIKNRKTQVPKETNRTWTVKSIDTMKFSRDLAQEKLKEPSFDETIDIQVRFIKETGATHIAIGTPYDEKFIPYLRRWVIVARKYNLNVWFRGNFSGWEGWFGETKNLNRAKHIQFIQSFIRNNPDLFEDGDIFTPCPECENGGPGDPRSDTNLDDFRKFMISENSIASEEFYKLKKDVVTNFASMNYDVAKLVMDQETLRKMGGIIVVDHYVNTPQKLSSDIDYLIRNKNSKVILGEIGVPIQNIHQNMTDQSQAEWLNDALDLLSQKENVIGINYWVSHGGSTAIFNDDNTPKEASDILQKYYKAVFHQ